MRMSTWKRYKISKLKKICTLKKFSEIYLKKKITIFKLWKMKWMKMKWLILMQTLSSGKSGRNVRWKRKKLK